MNTRWREEGARLLYAEMGKDPEFQAIVAGRRGWFQDQVAAIARRAALRLCPHHRNPKFEIGGGPDGIISVSCDEITLRRLATKARRGK